MAGNDGVEWCERCNSRHNADALCNATKHIEDTSSDILSNRLWGGMQYTYPNLELLKAETRELRKKVADLEDQIKKLSSR